MLGGPLGACTSLLGCFYIRTQLDTLGFTYDFDTTTSTPWALALCLPSSRIVTRQVGCLASSHSLVRRFPRISMCRRRRCSLYPHGLTYGATLRWPLRNPQSRSVPVLAGVSSASAPSPRRRQHPASEAQALPPESLPRLSTSRDFGELRLSPSSALNEAYLQHPLWSGIC